MKRTPLYEEHVRLGAKMVEFAGWEMPLNYPQGILFEHLSTRKAGGLFDISHMGRFAISGDDALPFLQHVLTSNVAALEPGESHYTLLANETGGAIDDAFLYMLDNNDYLLVVNAANTEKDWAWLLAHRHRFPRLLIEDRTEQIAMLSLQGPMSKQVLEAALGDRRQLPKARRNSVAVVSVFDAKMPVARTGYTGEPLGFELFPPGSVAVRLWRRLLEVGEKAGIVPVGLGARDTLRLEAGLPLYGHELGTDAEGKEIPVLALPAARSAVSFVLSKRDSIGRRALLRQCRETKSRLVGLLGPRESLHVPRTIRPLLVKGSGVPRQGYGVYKDGRQVGTVTSGTVVPYWKVEGEGLGLRLAEESGRRAICLAYIDSDLGPGETLQIMVRGQAVEAAIVERNLRSIGGRFTIPVLDTDGQAAALLAARETSFREAASGLVDRAHENTLWRQTRTVNLIPSEQTPSPLVRLLTIADPSGRYAEHARIKSLGDRDVFYYQGTRFIGEVEQELIEAMKLFLGCSEVEVRVVSGQMANMAVFSGLVHHLNRADRKVEPRRLRCVMNHYLGAGGHLSAQPLGGLRDYVAIDPLTERPAVINFPLLAENPYRIDLARVAELIERHRPELVILGKSLVLHPEPVADIARMIGGLRRRPILMYDAAHVLGLLGPYFQEPFLEGADIVTGSTHKTFFGTQRGVIASNMSEGSEYEPLWNSIVRRSFPGSVSNHHLGTLLGLLMATYEMNTYGRAYQRQVLANAKAFARALKHQGLHPEGDPSVGYTETHQVVLRIGPARGIEAAERLEANNIIVNYQALPDDEAFTASSGIRMGVQEMTRFGMRESDFGELAEYIAQVILHDKDVSEKVSRFRGRFLDMHYCLPIEEARPLIERLLSAVL